MNFELVTLDGVKSQGQVYSVVLPTASGQITVLPGHEPLLSQLVPGVITVRRTKGDPDHHLEHFATFGGVVEIRAQSVRVLVDEAASSEEVNEAEARKAHEEALRMRKEAKNQVELEHAQQLIDRSAVRLQIADLKRRHHRQ
jgi:ATP synthase, F1 epsilon subunit (delta in mitochondria)